jgi:type IV pilus assembly protein PilV
MQRDQNKGPRDREGGFTLLEIIIAISILTIGLLAVASMQSAAIRGNQLGYRVTEGTMLAQDRLEFLLTKPYNDALLTTGNDIEDPLTAVAAPLTPTPSGYSIKYDVADVAGINAKLITVRVSLQDRGVTRTTQLKCVRPELL